MERIRKYNQVLLAVFGTLVTVFVLVGGLMLLLEFYQDIFPNTQLGEEGVMVVEDESPDSVLKRFQEVTYLDPVHLDSGLTEFVIPVSQINLEVSENVRGPEAQLGLLDTFESSEFVYLDYYGYFNNFLLYNNKIQTYRVIFDFKVFNQPLDLHKFRKQTSSDFSGGFN